MEIGIWVAPFAGAWIEMSMSNLSILTILCRTLRGCVDWNSIGGLLGRFICVAPFAGAWIEILIRSIISSFINVAPFAGAWIEIASNFFYTYSGEVAPFAGAWIEILAYRAPWVVSSVAPFAGAWIEINSKIPPPVFLYVAPFAGAWIEIFHLPTWMLLPGVAPFAGAWIEIECPLWPAYCLGCRTLRGCVDWNSIWPWIIGRCWTSHPSRVRGLKFLGPADLPYLDQVAPFAGAWIEIVMSNLVICQDKKTNKNKRND